MDNLKEKELQEPAEAVQAQGQNAEAVEPDEHTAHSGDHSDGHHHHSGHHHSSHHSEHHSGHHSSKKHKSSKRRPKTRFGKFLAKRKSVMVNVAVIVLAFLSVLAISYVGEMRYQSLEDAYESGQGSSGNISNDTIQVAVSLFDEEVSLVGKAVRAYMRADSSIPVGEVVDSFREAEVRLDIGASVTIAYEVLGVPDGCSVSSVKLEVFNDSETKTFTLASDENSVAVKFLKTGTDYGFRFTICLSNDTETIVGGSFQTADTPRVLSIGGLVNVRDVGGWDTADGRTIRQGLLYRGSEMDGAVESAYKLTNDGLQEMLTVLGIRTDMDLRSRENTPAAADSLGANVTHTYYAAPAYGSIFTEDGKEAIRKIFSDLAVPAHYPVYLHCTYGLDRTGTVCYLLEALLGVSEEDLVRDYELSALVHTAVSRNTLTEMISILNTYEGETMQEKVESYLLSIGVTQQQIDSIREILL